MLYNKLLDIQIKLYIQIGNKYLMHLTIKYLSKCNFLNQIMIFQTYSNLLAFKYIWMKQMKSKFIKIS